MPHILLWHPESDTSLHSILVGRSISVSALLHDAAMQGTHVISLKQHDRAYVNASQMGSLHVFVMVTVQ